MLPTQSHNYRHPTDESLPLRCVKLGDAAYLAVAQHCTELQELRLYASLPSARAIQAFSALKHLQLLDICGAHHATGELIYSAEHSPCTVCE